MKVPVLHVGAFPLLLLSLMALTSAFVDGKYFSFFFYYNDYFSTFPNFLRSCIATVHPTLKIRQLMILILGPVARSMVSVNQRLIPWQRIGFDTALPMVKANHALSNSALLVNFKIMKEKFY